MLQARAAPLSSENPQLGTGLSKACNISDCRVSIDHSESFLLEPLMVKYLMCMLSLLLLALQGSSAFFFFFPLLFILLKYEVGHFWGGKKKERMNTLCFLSALS